MNGSAAALRAIENESMRGQSYDWPDRSCVSLISALCRELGGAEPDYSPILADSEPRAAVKARKAHGGMGAGHQAVLIDAGWAAVDKASLVQPGDVVSLSGRIELVDLTVYDPPRETGTEWTGIVGPDCLVWGWGPRGITAVRSDGSPAFITRYGVA